MEKKLSEKSNKTKMGRPKINISEEQYEQIVKLISIGHTEVEIADILEISIDTLKRRVKEDKGITFAQFYKKNSSGYKSSIRRSLYMQMTDKKNPVVTMFLGKTVLGLTEDKEYKDFNKQLKLKELKLKEQQMNIKEKELELKLKLLENMTPDSNIQIIVNAGDTSKEEIEVIESNV